MSKKFGLNPQQAADLGNPSTPSRLGTHVAPGGSPSAAGKYVSIEDGPGQRRFSSARKMTSAHLGGTDLAVPTSNGKFGSTLAAESSAQYLKGSQNQRSPYDNPNSLISPEDKVAASVDPSIRAVEESVGIAKRRKSPLNY